MKEHRLLARRSSVTGLMNTAGSAVISLSAIPFVISHVGVDGYGTIALIFLIQGLANILELGVPRAIIQNLSRSRAPRSFWAHSRRILISKLLVVCLIAIVMVGLVSHFDLSWLGLEGANLILATFALCIILCSSLALTYTRALFEANLNVEISNIYSFLGTMVI